MALPADFQPAPMWRIGLTGGIGSGKSTVAQMLASLGAHIIDADAISRQSTAPGGAALAAIAAQFGPTMASPESGLNRAAMRELIFTNANARKQLEAIVHPVVRFEMLRQAQDAETAWLQLQKKQQLQQSSSPASASPLAKTALLVFDIPLLTESSHWRSELSRVLVVDCNVEVQTIRTMARDSSSRETVALAIAAQASRSARLATADACIHNGFDTSLEKLRCQAQQYAQLFGL